jgi:hypothetical protein
LIKDTEKILPLFESWKYNSHYADHPFFGHLTFSQAKRNIIVHTHHHLKIINDILP